MTQLTLYNNTTLSLIANSLLAFTNKLPHLLPFRQILIQFCTSVETQQTKT